MIKLVSANLSRLGLKRSEAKQDPLWMEITQNNKLRFSRHDVCLT